MEKKRKRDDEVPSVNQGEPWAPLFKADGVVLIHGGEGQPTSLPDLKGLYEKASADQTSFTVENAGSSGRDVAPGAFLSFDAPHEPAYVSWILQHDVAVRDKFFTVLPHCELPGECDARYGAAVWVFCGRNAAADALPGRPPHTDSISHDGTFHFQLAGAKLWHLSKNGIEYDVLVKAGDFLVVDTKHWTHSTEIPAHCELSISYARDVYLDQEPEQEAAGMMNVEGPYATEPIEAGTVLFNSKTDPDISLGRSHVPNCALVDLDDATAVISVTDIPPGDFFCIAYSDDEEEDDDDEDDEDE